MKRLLFVVPLAVLALSLALHYALREGGRGERRIAGTVLEARPGDCEARKLAACMGTVTIAGAGEELVIEVPRGTPISAGCEPLSLGELPGRRVTVTEVEQVATAIADARHGAC